MTFNVVGVFLSLVLVRGQYLSLSKLYAVTSFCTSMVMLSLSLFIALDAWTQEETLFLFSLVCVVLTGFSSAISQGCLFANCRWGWKSS